MKKFQGRRRPFQKSQLKGAEVRWEVYGCHSFLQAIMRSLGFHGGGGHLCKRKLGAEAVTAVVCGCRFCLRTIPQSPGFHGGGLYEEGNWVNIYEKSDAVVCGSVVSCFG